SFPTRRSSQIHPKMFHQRIQLLLYVETFLTFSHLSDDLNNQYSFFLSLFSKIRYVIYSSFVKLLILYVDPPPRQIFCAQKTRQEKTPYKQCMCPFYVGVSHPYSLPEIYNYFVI